MNPSSIKLKFEHFFAKVALLLNGSYFGGIVLSQRNKTLEWTLHPIKLDCLIPRKFKRYRNNLYSFFGNLVIDSVVSLNLF